MAYTSAHQSSLSESEIETLHVSVVKQARRMSTSQILDLADELHTLIRSRQAARQRLDRRHGQSAF